MELNLAGKTAIITGGASNIGRAISMAFGAEGTNTVVADIDETQGQKVVQQIKQGTKALYVKVDVTDHTSVEAMVAKVLKEFGKIDILVNGVGWLIDRLFIEKPRAEWEKEINLNLWSDINCIRAVIEHMIERKYGKIVNIASDAGRAGEYREAVYSACKGGIIAMSKSLTKEVSRYGININCVCPGLIVPDESDVGEGSMWKGDLLSVFTPEAREKAIKAYPLRRLGKGADIASAVVFLASDAASYITGQTLSVSGGYTLA
ncbi:SDR family NAD(P)-dependent oxidoreductase [Chloroflexota bacterium]